MELYDYQKNLITQMSHGLKNAGSVCVQLQTGGGKSVMIGWLVNRIAQNSKRVIVMAHRRELVIQLTKTFRAFGSDVGVIASGLDENPSALIQVCMVQTLINRLDRIEPPQYIITDECHRVMGATYIAIHNKFPSAKCIGFSATPTRLDGRGLKDVYKSIVQGPSTQWLIDNGFLSPFKIYAPKNFLDLSKIKTVMGEYEQSKLEAEVMRPQVIGNVALEYIRRAHGKRTIMFAASVKHSEALVTQLQLHNVKAIHLDANSDKPLRADALELLARGEVDVISNVGLFSEGLDIKAVECVIDASPTQSLVNFLQRCGRALRTHEGKAHAIIIDMAGNVFRHGMPNETRTWTLEDMPKRKRGKTQNLEPVRVCEKCYAANPQDSTHCSECGHVFPIQSRKIEEREGELSEITEVQKKAKQLQRKKEQAECKTIEDLIALGEARGYANPSGWAHFVFSGRGARRV